MKPRISAVLPNAFYQEHLDKQLQRKVPIKLTYQYQALIIMEKNVNKIRENVEIIKAANSNRKEVVDLRGFNLNPYGNDLGIKLQLDMWPFDSKTMRSPDDDLAKIYNDDIDQIIKILDQYQMLLFIASKYFWDPDWTKKLIKTDDDYHITLGHYLASDYDFDPVESCPIASSTGKPFVVDN